MSAGAYIDLDTCCCHASFFNICFYTGITCTKLCYVSSEPLESAFPGRAQGNQERYVGSKIAERRQTSLIHRSGCLGLPFSALLTPWQARAR